MFFIRVIIIIISTTLLIPFSESFAASGTVSSGSTNFSGSIATSKGTGSIEKESEKESIEDIEEKKTEEKKTESNFSKLTTEMFKIQGNKILKDIDKAYPDDSSRLNVYYGIRKTLTLRKKYIEKSEFSNDAKTIITDYLSYMIASIEKRIEALEKNS